ncbi:MAG: hybrid sensor histidine kinase/response regulator [Magnetococcus sp. YQC-5]
MIEDEELRKLFEAESEEHLQKLDDGFLQLEKHANNPEVLKELFREAHSLKGAARMLGVESVETLSHRLEDILGTACRQGTLQFSPELVDRLTRGLDDIRAMVRESVTGESSGVSLFEALQRLMVQDNSPVEPSATAPILPGKNAIASADPMIEAKPILTEQLQPAPVTEPEPRPVVSLPVPQAPQPESRPVAPVPMPAPVIDPEPQLFESLPLPQLAIQPESRPVAQVPLLEPVTDPEPRLNESLPSIEPPSDPKKSEVHEPQVGSAADTKPVAVDASSTSVIRVDSSKLDQLLNLVGELTVVRTRVKRRLNEIEETIAWWEDAARQMCRTSTGNDARLEPLGLRLHELRNGIFADEVALDGVARELEEGIHNLRLLPLFTLFSLFPRMVRDLARQQSKQVTLVIEGGETTADKRIIEEMKSPLIHLVRNAVDHGQESTQERIAHGKPAEGTIRMRAFRTATHVVIEVSDDGRGLDLAAIKRSALKQRLVTEGELGNLTDAQLISLIFQSGFSTSAMVTDVSGRGVGLDVVRANVERLKGSVQAVSDAGKGSCFTIRLPITLATTPVFIVNVGDQPYAIPLDYVHSVRRVNPDAIFSIEGQDAIVVNGAPVSVVHLSDVLGIAVKSRERSAPPWPCIILTVGEEWMGVFVDAVVDELEVVMKPHGGILSRVRNSAGATILGSGEVCMVLNPSDLIKTVQKQGGSMGMVNAPVATGEDGIEKTSRKIILLAEDSITTRIQEKRILEGAGYEVVVAVDGADAFNKLGQYSFDAVVSDIQMPNLDGLGLTARIRQNASYRELPIILVTSLSSDEDLRRGLEAGANAYITKPTFDQQAFLETLRRLV